MKHKKDWGPGYRFFECENCEHNWIEKSRDCTSFSVESCPACMDETPPNWYEEHYEWATDNSGNLLEEQ